MLRVLESSVLSSFPVAPQPLRRRARSRRRYDIQIACIALHRQFVRMAAGSALLDKLQSVALHDELSDERDIRDRL